MGQVRKAETIQDWQDKDLEGEIIIRRLIGGDPMVWEMAEICVFPRNIHGI